MTLYKKIIFLIFPFIFSLSFAQTTHVLSIDTKLKRLPFGLTEQVPAAIPTVALALSGGGARGLAQIGVIKALKDANIPIDIIAGTSIGSIIGGLYASGYSLDQLDSIVVNTGWDALLASDRLTNRRELFVDQKITEDKEIFALRLQGLKPVLPTALNNGQKISSYLNLLSFQAPIHADSNFDELRVKFRAVCTDLVTGQPVILGKGSLSQAMRASSSVSFFLAPLKYDSLLLVDGGLVANIPVKIASDLGGQYVIAVKTTSDLHPEGELALPWDVADQTISIPMRLLNDVQLKYANRIIAPDLDDIAINDFSNVDSLILIGYQSVMPNISGIKQQIDSLFRENLGVKEYYIKNVLFDSGASDIYRSLLQSYSMRDSVSNIDILKDICTLYTTGVYKNITANIIQYRKYSVVKFDFECNPLIKNIAVQGITLINKQLVDSLLNTLVERPYNAENLVSELIQVLNLYRAKGYCLANIDKIKFNSETGKLNLIFDEGKINAVVTEGNKYTNSYIITRELPIKVGDYFNYNSVKQGLINLRATNLFDDILLTVKREDKKNIIVIRVREVAESLVRVGFKIDNENNAQLSLDLVDENLFGSGSELGLLLSGSSKGRALSIEDKSNRIFNTYLTYKLNAFYKFDDIYTYTEAASTTSSRFSLIQNGLYRQIFYGGSISLGTQVERWGNLIFEGKYQYNQVEKIQDSTQINPYFYKIVSLKVSTTVDTQDKYPYPMRGIYFKSEYESALNILGGNVGYYNFDFDYKSYFTLDRAHTFSPRFFIGFADNTLPSGLEYSLGGQNSFFGMRNDEFRGNQIFLTSFEYRYKFPFQVFFDTYFKFRYDLGSTWPTQQAFRFKDLRHGIGTSLSFDTPIGPADFAVGKSFKFVKNLPGNPLSFGDTFVYFSIGYYY